MKTNLEDIRIVMKLKTRNEMLGLTTANDKIKINLTGNEGPELELDNGDYFIFNNMDYYYKFAYDFRVYNSKESIIKIGILDNAFLVAEDEVGTNPYALYRNKKVKAIKEYQIEYNKFYLLEMEK